VKYRLAYFVILGCTGGIIFQRPFGLKARQLSNARDADSFGSRARQSHAKDCAVRIVCSHLKTPPVGVNDGAADGKSYSGSLGLSCKERFEDLILVFLVYSRPGVFDGHQNAGRVLNDIGPDPQQA